MTSLRHQARRAAGWSGASQIGSQLLQVGTTVVLANLLAPEDFGLLGMATVVVAFVGLFRDLGTSAAVIRSQNPSEPLLSSIFWLNVGFGLLAMATVLLSADWISAFYAEPRVAAVLRWISLVLMIVAPSILSQTLLEKRMAFRALAAIQLMAALCGSVVGIGAAFAGCGVWSLVYQALVAAFVNSAGVAMAAGWLPRPIFRWAEIRSISSYSLNIVGFNALNYFARNADNLLIGRFFGAESLGFYTLAYRIMLYPLQNISAVIGRVMFPLYSVIQEDTARFRLAYLKTVGAIAMVTFPLMASLYAVASPLVLSMFGEKWDPVSVLLLILAPVGMAQSIITTVGAIYQVKGRTDWMFRWGIFASACTVTAFVIGLRWGIVGVASAYAIASAALTIPALVIPFRLIELRLGQLRHVLWRPLLCSALMLTIMLAGRSLLPPNMSALFVVVILSSLGGLGYLVATLRLNPEPVRDLLG